MWRKGVGGYMAYKEKRYGKRELKILAGVVLAVAIALVLIAVAVMIDLNHWAKFVVLGCNLILALGLLIFGVFLLIIISSTHDETKSVRDGNESKGIANAKLCDKCGRVMGDKADFCEFCGAEDEEKAIKKCAKCGEKNKGSAQFCVKCGEKLD